MKVLLLEPIHRDGVKLLEEIAQVVYAAGHSEDEIAAAASDMDAIIIRNKGFLSESVFEKAKRLKCVARHGVGVDNIDVKAATRRKLPVCFAPGANTESVAEHAILLMLAVGKRTAYLDREVRKGRWWELRTLEFFEMKGRSVGLIGLGRIGSRVADLAQAFGMKVFAHDPFISPEEMEARGVTPLGRDELLKSCDVVSLHLPLLPESRKLLGAREFGMMKEGAILINTGRGGLVDEEALCSALRSGRLFGAGLDVTDPEPPSPQNPLFGLDSVIFSPHMAAHSTTSMRNMAVFAAEQVVKVLKGERPTFIVNPEVLEAKS
jgi:D-3-phosphoglycerate dehydrogenase / 2-oxoglutarate reductase